ncbi:MAG TPA: hypothetical protein VF395_20100, partial [Polyangiaceae bacterium]
MSLSRLPPEPDKDLNWMRHFSSCFIVACVLFSTIARAERESPAPPVSGEPPKASAEPAPPAMAAKPDAAPKTAPEKPSDGASQPTTTAPAGVVQMENTAGSGPSTEPVITGTPAAGSVPGVEPATPGALAETTRGGPAAALKSDDWHFDFHGYLRAPMRVGLGHNDKPAAGQSSSSLHAPIVPDDQYLSWQHTKHNEKDWAELFLSYGNAWAKGTVALQGFNFT